MRRIKDGYLELIDSECPLSGMSVLEIGCGNGERTVEIAYRAGRLTSMDPDREILRKAVAKRSHTRTFYLNGSGESLSFRNSSFDITIFTLSFHHIPMHLQAKAISEAIRVTRRSGFIVFFEPDFDGAFFEAEILFDACDGDERKAKAFAYYSILSYPYLANVKELKDETVFQFDSYVDFLLTMNPMQNLSRLERFLEKHNYILTARRRINICQPIKPKEPRE